ncbi:MAG: hypothetical protein LUQ38_04145 [Methanotrichaceae archaeon]|nr:hypothetical protein [Methanotrichaceae archaeon]
MSRKITVFLAVLVALVLPVMGESMSSGGSMMSGSPISSGSSVMPGGSMIGTPAAGVPAAASTSAATWYTQCQQEVIGGIGLGFFMGRMATLASQGYNVTGFNAEVDRFNAWIQQNFGNDPNLLMPKMQETAAGMAGSIPVTPNK